MKAKRYYDQNAADRRRAKREHQMVHPVKRVHDNDPSSAERMAREPLKERARRLLRYAVRKGRIHKPSACEQCGETPSVPLHGHHADYSRPLAVRWLCHRCHMLQHRKDVAHAA